MIDAEIKGSACRLPTIAIDASRANCSQRTGVEWYSFRLIQELKKVIPANYRVILYSQDPLRDGLEDLPPNWESRVLKWSIGRLWTQIRLSWEVYRRPPDLLFVPAHTLPLILPKVSVITVHDVGFMAYPIAYSWKERLFQKWSTSRAAQKASKILTVSDFSKKEIIKYFDEAKDKVTVVPLAFDPYRFLVQERGEILSAAGRHRLRPPYFLFVGRLEKKKNIDGLIKAFRMFHEKYAGQVGARQLALVGPSGKDYMEAKELIIDSPALDFVREVGYAEDADLPLLYSGAEALVFPSHYEGFGLPVLEAFASRIPVIISRSGSLPEVAGDAAEYVDSGSPEELAEAMYLIARDDDRRDALIQAGEVRLQQFSWKKTAEGTWDVLEKAIKLEC